MATVAALAVGVHEGWVREVVLAGPAGLLVHELVPVGRWDRVLERLDTALAGDAQCWLAGRATVQGALTRTTRPYPGAYARLEGLAARVTWWEAGPVPSPGTVAGHAAAILAAVGFLEPRHTDTLPQRP